MIPSLHALTHVLRAAGACPAQPSCLLAKDDQCTITYPENGVTTQVFCSPKFYGGDLVPPFQIATLTGCSRQCSRTTGCVAAAYEGGNCYLKSQTSGDPVEYKTGVIGVTVLSGTPRPYSTPICPTDFSCPEDNGCSTTDGSRWLKLECRADYALDTVDPTTAPSIEACSQLCFKNPLCKSLTFVGGKAGGDCYLKGEKLPDTVTNYRDHTDGLYLADAPSSPSNPTTPDPPVTNPLACNRDDGITFVANSKTFLVRCNVDYTGADIRGVPNTAGDLNTCINVCAQEPNCKSVVLNGGECFLKSTIGVRKTGPGALGAELLPSPSTCAVLGKVTRGITYTDIKEPDLTECKTQCQNYSLADLKCRVFGRNPTTGLCTLSLGSTAPTFDQAFESSQSSGQFWTTEPESPQYWYGDDCGI